MSSVFECAVWVLSVAAIAFGFSVGIGAIEMFSSVVKRKKRGV